MKPKLAMLFTEASAAALVHALKDWRAAHAPQMGYEGMFAEFFNNVQITTRIVNIDESAIQVTILAAKKQDSEHYYFIAHVSGGELKLQRITS